MTLLKQFKDWLFDVNRAFVLNVFGPGSFAGHFSMRVLLAFGAGRTSIRRWIFGNVVAGLLSPLFE